CAATPAPGPSGATTRRCPWPPGPSPAVAPDSGGSAPPVIVILQADVTTASETGRKVLEDLRAKPGITPKVQEVTGTQQVLSEIYLVGDTSTLDRREIESLPGVDSVVKVSRSYAVIGRHADDTRSYGFNYNGVRF